MKITERIVATLTLPAGKDDVVFWDDDLPGFGIRLRGNTKRWLVQYRANGIQRREVLGDTRKVRLEMARKAARQRFARVELGEDPGAAKKAARAAAAVEKLTLANVSDRYLDARRATMRSSSYADAERYFTVHWGPLCDRPIDDVTRADVAAVLQDLAKAHGPVAASRARAHLSAMYGWAMREGLAQANPVVSTNDPGEGRPSRDRVLSMDELAVIWRACKDDDFGRIVKLLMLTGCRRTEIGGLQWNEIDLDAGGITISAERAKNGRALALALPPVALDLLQSVEHPEGREALFGINGDRGFTVWSTSTAELNARIAAQSESLPHWTLHDIRRSTATHMAELGIQPHIVEAILNHVSGHKAGVAGIYNRATYGAEKRQALALWADHLMAALEGRERKVIPMRSA